MTGSSRVPNIRAKDGTIHSDIGMHERALPLRTSDAGTDLSHFAACDAHACEEGQLDGRPTANSKRTHQ